MTSSSLISHVCETRKFVMAILNWKQGVLCDKTNVEIHVVPKDNIQQAKTYKDYSYKYFFGVNLSLEVTGKKKARTKNAI